jgi:hypothetical protein
MFIFVPKGKASRLSVVLNEAVPSGSALIFNGYRIGVKTALIFVDSDTVSLVLEEVGSAIWLLPSHRKNSKCSWGVATNKTSSL